MSFRRTRYVVIDEPGAYSVGQIDTESETYVLKLCDATAGLITKQRSPEKLSTILCSSLLSKFGSDWNGTPFLSPDDTVIKVRDVLPASMVPGVSEAFTLYHTNDCRDGPNNEGNGKMAAVFKDAFEYTFKQVLQWCQKMEREPIVVVLCEEFLGSKGWSRHSKHPPEFETSNLGLTGARLSCDEATTITCATSVAASKTWQFC